MNNNRKMVCRKWSVGLLVLALGAAAGGCAGYRLGSSLPPGIHSVHVPTFINATDEPQIEAATTSAAIAEFVRDGTLRVADADTADTVVQVTMTSFRLIPVRYEKEQESTTREYRMEIAANVEFRKCGETKPILTRKIVGDTTFFPGADTAQEKRNALPKAAKDLAHKVVESVVEFW